MGAKQTQSLSFYVKTLALGLVVLAFAITKQIQTDELSYKDKLLVETSSESELIEE